MAAHKAAATLAAGLGAQTQAEFERWLVYLSEDLDSYEAARRGRVSAPVPVADFVSTPTASSPKPTDTAESVQADKTLKEWEARDQTLEDQVLAGGVADDDDIPF
jgi:hypothetical protein